MKKFWCLTLLILLGLSVGILVASAAETGSVVVDVNVIPTQEFISGPAVTLTTPDAEDYNAGYTRVSTSEMTVRSNVPWKLEVSTETWSWPTNKLVTDFEWKLQESSEFNQCSSAFADVKEGEATAGELIKIDYRMKLNWAEDGPGDYIINQYYTLSTK